MQTTNVNENRARSPAPKGPWILVSLALFLAGLLIGQARRESLTPATTAAEVPTPVAIFSEAWTLLHEHYVDPAALDDKRLQAGALRGLADAVGDNGHTRYLTPEELAQHSEQLAGEYAGVGIEIEERDGLIIVRDVFEGSPAQRAGLEVGDVLVAVDGLPVQELGLDGVVQHVRGQEGTPVTLTLKRPSESVTFEVTLVRAKIRAPVVRWALLPEQVGLVRIGSFSSGATDKVRAALERLEQVGVRALILDLRGNPGGLVDEAVNVSGLFLPPDTVVFRSRDRTGNETTYRTKPDSQPAMLPLVVLVDRDSASAAEIVAGALQDYGRARIVGERTFGTGTVLIEFRLQDGSALLIGTQIWITPNDRIIWRNGIEPDVPVTLGANEMPLAPRNGQHVTLDDLRTDAQLTAAWQLLTGGDPAQTAVVHSECIGCR